MTHIDGVAALLCEMRDRTQGTGSNHDLMLINERVLIHRSEDIASRNMVANLRKRKSSLGCQNTDEGLYARCTTQGRNPT